MKFAKIISRLFDPLIVLSFLTVITVLHSGLTGAEFLTFLCVFLIGVVLPPALLLWWAVKTGRVSDWDVSQRKQRIHVLVIALIFLAADMALFWALGNSALLALMQMFIWWYVGFLLITLFWKISGHVGIATLAGWILHTRLGFSVWPLVFTLPVIAWSRVALKRHTVGQVIAGALYSGIVVLFLPIIE